MERWDDVRFFLAIARESSLSGAARALRVDHATVGRRLTALEQRLGAKLFNRTPEGFAITSAGQAMLKQAEAMEAAALAVERLASGHDERSSGLVRVTTRRCSRARLSCPRSRILWRCILNFGWTYW
jgi:DNA-binding transcriptional LysR family regulator